MMSAVFTPQSIVIQTIHKCSGADLGWGGGGGGLGFYWGPQALHFFQKACI